MALPLVSKHIINVAGLPVNVYGLDELVPDQSSPLAAFILVHGITADANIVEETALATFSWAREQRRSGRSHREFIVVSFDMRNHGHRLLDPRTNRPWHRSANRKISGTYAVDAVGIAVGTAQDMTFIIDFLPLYLFPRGEKTISTWAAAGISLGSHAIWFALRSEPRLRVGIIIMGCPDNATALRSHAEMAGIPFAPPYVPNSLVALLERADACTADYGSSNVALNPFFGKSILNLTADADESVPKTLYERVWNGINVGPHGRKQSLMFKGTHIYTHAMMRDVVRFFWEEAIEQQDMRARL